MGGVIKKIQRLLCEPQKNLRYRPDRGVYFYEFGRVKTIGGVYYLYNEFPVPPTFCSLNAVLFCFYYLYNFLALFEGCFCFLLFFGWACIMAPINPKLRVPPGLFF